MDQFLNGNKDLGQLLFYYQEPEEPKEPCMYMIKYNESERVTVGSHWLSHKFCYISFVPRMWNPQLYIPNLFCQSS